MVSNEVWTGTGQSVTMAPESELFLGYMPFGPTVGRTGTNRSHLIKYSLGYGLDGASVTLEANHGETLTITVNDAADDGDATITVDSSAGVVAGMSITGTDIPSGTTISSVSDATTIVLSASPDSNLTDNAVLTLSQNIHFTDYYHLVPDLYTGCTAKFYSTTASGTAATLEFTARVAGNDADAIYFSGNLADFPSLFADQDAAVSTTNKRGYIVLEANGAIVPAPISLENRATVTSYSAGSQTISFTAGSGSVEHIKAGDLIYEAGGGLVGEVWTAASSASLSTSRADAITSSTHLHFLSSEITTSDGASSGSNGILSLSVDATLTGIFTAGDYISFYASDTPASATILGRIITMNSTGLTLTIAQSADAAITDADSIYWGRHMASASTDITIHTVSPRILSNHWLVLTNSITTPTSEVEMRQMNLSLGGTRNFSYQYRGMETAGQASLDVNLNHGAWLYYAFGTLSSLSATNGADKTHTNNFQTVDSAPSNHILYAGVDTQGVDDRASASHSTNGKFHRVLKGSQALCPPLLPNTSAFLVTDPSTNDTSGALQNGITYTLSENNSAKLPSFAMELLVQKPSVLAGSSQSLMVDRNTYNESVYAQIYPGLVVSDMTLSANENEELKGSINLNSKTVIEAPDGYVGKCYDATNNDTTEFKNLLNFGQQTGANAECEQAFLDPFFFSNGSISLFGQEFLKVSSFTLNIQNGVTDKRYVGQYNNRIKDYVTGQRTYEVSIQALVTDRRIFDELRKLSPNRVALTDALIDLEFTKSNGENITLSFDDYMISTSTWPIQDDRGPIQVDFTIMPLRVTTLSTTTHWVIQS
jgi:hypothetical protein